jgi:phosphatidylglycerophosphate synthase
VACATLFVLAIARHSEAFMLAGLAANMTLDSLDGEIARRCDKETILGAQLDGAIDRLAVVLLIFSVIAIRGDAATAVIGIVVWLQFGVVDHVLSTQFLRFGLWSPDHFYEIDSHVWRVNWSPLAKLVSNLPVLLLAASPVVAWVGLLPAFALIAVRLWSYGRVRRAAVKLLPELGYALGPRAPDRYFKHLLAPAPSVAPESEPRPLVTMVADAVPGAAMAGDRVATSR